MASDPDIGALRARFETFGQGHVFGFWDRLDAAGRERLASQAAALDLESLARALEHGLASAAGGVRQLEPVEVEELPRGPEDEARFEEARKRGEALLAEGRVAAMVVAGGQGTRLGFDGPKGLFPLGPVSGRTLFALQAEKLRGVRRRCGQPVPWYVMTSSATDATTRAYFEGESWLGLPPEDVFLLRQGMVPSFDFDGRLILDRPDHIFENPNGHGGSLTALLDSGALDDMERRGVDTLFYYQVDNPLIRICDPVFLGFHDAAGAEMSCKVIRKLEPMEKMGIVARVDGRAGVVEYTELDETHRFATESDGGLSYWTGNAAIHVFSTAFVRRVAGDADALLPYHPSDKKIPTLDDAGRPVSPSEPNGRKLERFVFDALPAAERVCVVEAERAREYSPVKNAEGSDSPETARRDLMAQYREWLEAGGITPPRDELPLELDHSRIDGPDDAGALGAASIEAAGDAIRTSPGAEA